MPPKSKKKNSTPMTTINAIPEKYKSYIEEKKKEIQKKFTEFVTNNSITFIYGGKTTKTVNERHIQHKKEEPLKFKNTKYKLLIDCRKLKGETTENDATTVLSILESYLIELIQKQYPTKHDNDVKGGGGRESEQPKKNYYLYIIYK